MCAQIATRARTGPAYLAPRTAPLKVYLRSMSVGRPIKRFDARLLPRYDDRDDIVLLPLLSGGVCYYACVYVRTLHALQLALLFKVKRRAICGGMVCLYMFLFHTS